MKTVRALGKYVVCIAIKSETTTKSGLIIPDEKKAKIYGVYDAGESKKVKEGDRVLLTGYAQPVDIDTETYYIVQEEHLGAIIS
jgi:co-chaperonin GroES (HSP10)